MPEKENNPSATNSRMCECKLLRLPTATIALERSKFHISPVYNRPQGNMYQLVEEKGTTLLSSGTRPQNRTSVRSRLLIWSCRSAASNVFRKHLIWFATAAASHPLRAVFSPVRTGLRGLTVQIACLLGFRSPSYSGLQRTERIEAAELIDTSSTNSPAWSVMVRRAPDL